MTQTITRATPSAFDRLIRKWREFRRDRRGMLLQETAIAMPILISMSLGGVEIARFALLQQKLDRVAMTTSDMVSQGETISIPEMDVIFTATSTIMLPFDTGANTRVIVSSVYATGGTPAKVVWQRSGGGTLTGPVSEIGVVDANADLPPGFIVRDGENVIIAEVFYTFSPLFLPDLLPSQTLYHRSMFRPRFGTLTTMCATPCAP